MKILAAQLHQIADSIFLQKLYRSFSKSLPDFGKLTEDEKLGFLEKSITDARALGLCTEIGIASYVMGVWWLDFNFEKQSQFLLSILHSEFPEIRKVHGMNEWIQARLCSPADPVAADQALSNSEKTTAPWGMR